MNYNKKYRLKYPWRRTLESIKQRCKNPNNNRYEWYGLRGIKCLITEQELEFLWFRDKAYEMDKPSIDRKDNKGNYELSNCQYIESSLNSKKDKVFVPVIQYNLENIFIKKFISIHEASRKTGISASEICSVINNRRKTTHGFVFKRDKL